MQIVIDIPDKVYWVLKYFEEAMGLADKKDDDVKTALIRAAVNGIPLPEGHGRLIDADDMIEDLQRQCKEVFKLDAVKPEDYYIAKDAKFMQATWKEWCDSFCVWANNRKTIIEADEESEG